MTESTRIPFDWANPRLEHVNEMSELWHISRTAVAGNPPDKRGRYDRKLWVAAQMAKKYECSETGAYKAFERARIGEFC